MTKEELKPIDVSKYTVTESGNVIKDVKDKLKQEAEEYALKQWEGNLPWSVIQKSYYDGALPREKQIERLSKEVDDSENMKATLESRIAELEAQIEKMKNCRNCKKFMIEGVCGHFLQVGWCKNWELAK